MMTDQQPRLSPSLMDIAREVTEINVANGWHEDKRTFGEGIALIHSEVSEALEAYRQWGTADSTGLDTFVPHLGLYVAAKPEGVGSEFADILIRLLDECDRQGIDIDYELERKLAHNRTRGYRHGGKRL